jgi:hypothetical protein
MKILVWLRFISTGRGMRDNRNGLNREDVKCSFKWSSVKYFNERSGRQNKATWDERLLPGTAPEAVSIGRKAQSRVDDGVNAQDPGPNR